jgi:hypothetical protein
MRINPSIDPVCDAFLNGNFSELPDVSVEEADPFHKFLERGALAASIGGPTAVAHARVERFHEQGAAIEERFSKIHDNPPAKAEEDNHPDFDEVLAKSAVADPHARRLRVLREWVRKSLAMGETLNGLVEYARKYDPAQALLIQEAGQGL